MRPFFCFLIVANVLVSVRAQTQKTRNGAWFIPSTFSTKKINGLAIGPFSGCFVCLNDEKQTINGIDIEFIGAGIIPPIYYLKEINQKEDGNSYLENLADTLLPYQTINGLTISPGGIDVGFKSVVNGVNLSGLNTVTGKTNGISTGLIFCINQHLNGISVGGWNLTENTNGFQVGIRNKAKVLRGLQIGLFNNTTNLKGLQIGLWNKSNKRALPFLNFQF